jgi:hypothetical protein
MENTFCDSGCLKNLLFIVAFIKYLGSLPLCRRDVLQIILTPRRASLGEAMSILPLNTRIILKEIERLSIR